MDGIFLVEFFGRNFLEEFFGRIFWEDFFGRNFFGRIFGRNSIKNYLNMEGIYLFVKILVFVKILG